MPLVRRGDLTRPLTTSEMDGNWDWLDQSKQAVSAKLTAIAAAVWSANKIMYMTGEDTVGLTDFPAAARSFLSATTPTLQRNALGLGNVDNTSDANKPVSIAQAQALANKVDKVAGKGLSTNDYTDTDKQRVDNLNSASTYATTQSRADITPNRVMLTGDGGWMGDVPTNPMVANIDDRSLRGFRYFGSSTLGAKPPGVSFGHVLTFGNTGDALTQELWEIEGSGGRTYRKYMRSTFSNAAWGPWVRMATDKNSLPSDAGTLYGTTNQLFFNAPGITDAELGGNFYYSGAVEIREVNRVTQSKGGSSGYAPGITFHYGGYSVGKLWMDTNTVLNWGFDKVLLASDVVRGSNGNGEFVKFPDGTMICTGVVRMPAQPLNADNVVTLNFPAAFISSSYNPQLTPKTVIGTGSQDAIGSLLYNGIYTGGYNLSSMTVASYSYRAAVANPVDLYFTVTGRWK